MTTSNKRAHGELEEQEDQQSVVEKARTTEIQQRRQQIQEWQTRLTLLEKEHEQHVRKASLLCDASYEWTSMWGARDHHDKENILTALETEGDVPDCLLWNGNFGRCFPLRIKMDRDILLARLEHLGDDFESTYRDEAFPVPTRFRNDKEVMLAVCSKNSHALQLASAALRNDRDVVMAAITHRFHFAPFALQHASKKLRGDRRVVRAAVNREYGIRCWPMLAPKLQKDRRLAITSIRRSSEECSRFYEHLSELPQEPQNDDEVVMEAVKKRGSNLRFVTDSELLEDFNIVMAACEQDGTALQFVPKGPTRNELLERENFKIILANGGTFLPEEDMPSNLREDPELIFLAIQNGLYFLPVYDVLYDMYEQNPSLVMQAMNRNSTVYSCIPDDAKKIKEVGMHCLKSSDCRTDSLGEQIAATVVRNIPDFLDNPAAMLCIAKKGYGDVLEQASERILDNKTVMLAACQADGSLLSLASNRLQQEPAIVKAALMSGLNPDCARSDPDCVFLVSKEVFEQHPSLAEIAIETYDGDDHNRLFRHLPHSAFRNRNVLLAWLHKGWNVDRIRHSYWPTPVDIGLEHFTHDREVMLAMIKSNWRHARNLCASFQANRNFMKAALALDGRVWRFASGDLQQDFDMMLYAVGTNRKTLQNVSHTGKEFDDLVDFAARVRERLGVAETFIREVLRGIAIVDPRRRAPAKRCMLPMLDCGLETGAAFKRMIAEYAGVPLGEELTLIRSASANLEFWGY